MSISVKEMAIPTILFLLSLNSSVAPTAKKLSDCSQDVLPAGLNKQLKSDFSSWQPKRLSDMEADDQGIWLKGRNAKRCPGIVAGHFESAERVSYAILLVPILNPSGGHELLVFTKKPGNRLYTWKLLDESEEQTASELVIDKAEPGEYKDWEGKNAIVIKLNGLSVEWLEKAGQLYYWKADGYHTMLVSD